MSEREKQNHMNPNQGISENKLILIKNPVICLIVIGLVGLVIRIYSYPYDLPVYQDISDYFWYAIDMSILDEFPQMAPNQSWQYRHIQDIVFQTMVGLCFSLYFFR